MVDQTMTTTFQPLSQPNSSSSFKPNHHQNLPNGFPHQNLAQITLDQTKQIHAHLLKSHSQNPLQISLHFIQLPITLPARYNFLIRFYNHPKCALNIYAQIRDLNIES